MKVIRFDTEQELDQSDASKLAKYKLDVNNANAERFSTKIEHENKYYMVYVESMSKYYTEEEINRVEILNLQE